MSKRTDNGRPPITGIAVTVIALIVIIAVGVLLALILASQLPI